MYHVSTYREVGKLVEEHHRHPLVIMVPGILTSEGSEVAMGEVLEGLPSGYVGAMLHNESHGFVSDILECMVGKLTGSLIARESHSCPEYPARLLRWTLEAWEAPILVLAHSQGAILTHNALRGLDLKQRVHVRTFGGASWGSPDCDTARHWTMRNDPVGNLLGRGFVKGTQILPRQGIVSHVFSHYSEKAKWEIQDWIKNWN